MRFIYGKNDFKSIERGQENCYLLTNGLGGYSSLSMIGSNARNDHSLFMACLRAPNNRINIINNIGEKLSINNKTYDLTSQEFLDESLTRRGYRHLSKFVFDDLPHWTFNVNGVEIIKIIAMKNFDNTICIKYVVNNTTDYNIELSITPYLEFVAKGKLLNINQSFITTNYTISSNNIKLNYKTNGSVEFYDTRFIDNLFFSQDKRDGRCEVGCVAYNHDIKFKVNKNSVKDFFLIYSTNEILEKSDDIILHSRKYRNDLCEKCNIKNEVAKTLIKSSNQFIVKRDSTDGKSIIAGYPFFEDWGRDTMIALNGLTLATNQYEDAKSIYRTFIKYCNKGLMPNLFPEGKTNAMYNTVDASLLFINSLYEYYLDTNDKKFISECFDTLEQIIYWYKNGTDYDIKMDTDKLIKSGSGLHQVTWMDVRINDILPTPRHGKPVEINAYWYNALRIMDEFCNILNKDRKDYYELSEEVKKSFNNKFWNEEKNCLKDIVSDTNYYADNQIRCNQIWAVSAHFSILNREREKQVVRTVFDKLYTPYGLRTLSMDDLEFKGFYGGSQFERDLAYHQGTVWTFPLGAYYLAYLKVNNYSKNSIDIVKSQLEVLESALREGCIGQLPEIYDGENPSISKGCFAQAWSVGEILRVYKIIEEREVQ